MLKIPERIGSAKVVWQGPYPNKIVREQLFSCSPDGFYLWGLPKPSVLLFPVTANREVILTKQWRPGLICERREDEWVYEFPGGHAKPGQTDAGAMADEFMEEAGYVFHPDNVAPLGNFWVDPPSNSATVNAFLLFDCKKVGEPSPEKGEVIERVVMPLADWFREAFTGNPIHRDAKTIAATGLALPKLVERGLIQFHIPEGR